MQAEKNIENRKAPEDKPDSFWNRVYLAVLIYTILIILLLGLFSMYFS